MKHLLPLALAAAAAGACAQDRADIDRTQIIGNRELPKVLYIVPWKKPLPGMLRAARCTACWTKHWRRWTARSFAARWLTARRCRCAQPPPLRRPQHPLTRRPRQRPNLDLPVTPFTPATDPSPSGAPCA
jgi:hypothetical protein